MGKDSICNIYDFDIYFEVIITDCKLYPTEISSTLPWLYARNNKYPDLSIDPDLLGSWTLLLSKDCVDAAWDKIKLATAEGELWCSKVSKTEDFFAINIYTKDCTDVHDAFCMLDHFKSLGIKPLEGSIKYEKEKHTVGKEPWVYSYGLVLSTRTSVHHCYEFDIHKNELLTDSKLYPTEILRSEFEWLHAANNKYTDDSLDPGKIGRWMLSVSKDSVNVVWDKIKIAVKSGQLWQSLVSTTTLKKKKSRAYVIEIYTKDYNDLNDVINVLQYLESSGIKPLEGIMKYGKEKQIEEEKPLVYSHSPVLSTHTSVHHCYEFDIHKNELLTDSKLYPTEILRSEFEWLHAASNKYTDDSLDPGKIGRWRLSVSKDSVNVVWDKIKIAVKSGQLWQSLVSTTALKKKKSRAYVIEIYTKDYNDLNDVINVLHYLESSGIKPLGMYLEYKTVADIHGGCIITMLSRTYSSNAIRPICYTYEFDICKNEIVTDCNSYPTEVSTTSLFAKNNMYIGQEIDPQKMGKWMFVSPKCMVNAVWDEIKLAVTSGKLWSTKVSTTSPKSSSHGDDSYEIVIYTKDYTDMNDVINVLDYIESSGIKPPKVISKYVPDQETFQFGHKPWMYTSDEVQTLGSTRRLDSVVSYTYEFNFFKKEIVTDCNLYPTEVFKNPPWLSAKNNKYGTLNKKEAKNLGKWIIFAPKNNVNVAWDKIKLAVTNGDLWRCSVSTTDPENLDDFFVIMIYTKNLEKIDDVICVLDYLESSGIKPPNANIKYQKGENISELSKGIRTKLPWVYSSNLIRSVGKAIHPTYEFNIDHRKLKTDCRLHPTKTLQSDFEWLHAVNNKYTRSGLDNNKIGKWMVFWPKIEVDVIWEKIKIAVSRGELWRSSVSTTDPENPGEMHAIMIYTKDYMDLSDIINVLDYLESFGIKPSNANIHYSKSKQNLMCMDCGRSEQLKLYTSDTVRDVQKEKLMSNSNLNPSEVSKSPSWLHAKNKKYTRKSIDPKKVGKWMVFLPKCRVDTVWDKVKVAVASGDLWSARVSTKPGNSFAGNYAVFIYTINYTDVNDVVRVLDYLERARIKPSGATIKYKTDHQTDIGIYDKGRMRSWIYSSDTVRSVSSIQQSDDSICYTYEFDIYKKELITDCNLYPSQSQGDPPWLYAKNNKYTHYDSDKMGRWMLFLPKSKVNNAWNKIKLAIKSGELWRSHVSKSDPEAPEDDYAVMISTKDYTDLNDVISVLVYLENSRIKPPNVTIYYKTDQQTRLGYHSGGRKQPWIYASNTIRNPGSTQLVQNSICDTYEFDICKKELVTDCKSYPTEVSEIVPWLFAKNNKYADDTVDLGKVGRWTLFLPKCRVNAVWDKIKVAVANGELWSTKVSTKPGDFPFSGAYAVFINTKDYSDRNDVVRVLDYLESSRIKPSNAAIKYETEQQCGIESGSKRSSWMYSSDTVRSMCK